METSTTTATAAATITYNDVITKFKDLKKKYYTERGCMISTLYDNFVKEFIKKHPNLLWKQTYNSYAETDVLTGKINVIIFGRPF